MSIPQRLRLVYSKRDGACFVPHIALAQIFSRSASRAGLSLALSQGFSPRPKLSFAPELPAGVVALREVLDLYAINECTDILPRLNASLPEGFNVSQVFSIPEGSPSLGKSCTHAEYIIRPASSLALPQLAQAAKDFYAASAITARTSGQWVRLVIAAPAQNPIGSFVKSLIARELIQGWHNINIVRVSIGTLINGKVVINGR